jgi:molecular chaperone DnaK (HSP70)
MIHLGIDFGTANTRVSIYDGVAIPSPLPIGRSLAQPPLMPSACLIDSSGDVLVGEQTLSRPGRLRFVKRYWQDRLEDRLSNPWRDGRMSVAGKEFTCETVVERVIGEALTRAFALVGMGHLEEGFSVNIVCPVTFDLSRRHALARILSDQGAKSVTLSNVIDEPLAAAVLYGKVATIPPINKDLLVFDSGAGTTDLAIVRYHEEGDWKRITVLAEQGRCCAGIDLDLALQRLIIQKITALTGVSDQNQIYNASGRDVDVGKINLEDECEQVKIALTASSTYRWTKLNFLGYPDISFDITREAFRVAARDTLSHMEGALKALQKEASCFIDDFDGIDMALMVGGTSKLPLVQNIVSESCDCPIVDSSNLYFDEMVATARGVGFTKDFEDLVIKRPPYTIELRATLVDGSKLSRNLHEAFDCIYEWWQTFQTVLPCKTVRLQFREPIQTIGLFFISPSGRRQAPDLPLDLFRGMNTLQASLDLRANLRLEAGSNKITVALPYFTQVGLKAPLPFDRKKLNLPDFYPAEN